MRGNVTLHACIGGGAFSGRARPDGAVSDSQRSVGDGGTRTAGPDTHGYTIREQVGGNRGEIMAHCWRDGQVEGVFYGPQNALEAVGSFGVKAPASP